MHRMIYVHTFGREYVHFLCWEPNNILLMGISYFLLVTGHYFTSGYVGS